MVKELSIAAKVDMSLDELCEEEAQEIWEDGGTGYDDDGYDRASGTTSRRGRRRGRGRGGRGDGYGGRGGEGREGDGDGVTSYVPAVATKGLGKGKVRRYGGFARGFLGIKKPLKHGAGLWALGGPTGGDRLRRWGPRASQGPPGSLLALPFANQSHNMPYCTQRSIYFTGIPASITMSELTRVFETVGFLTKVALFTFPDGSSRGMGIAEYTSAEAADSAYRTLHNTALGGYRLIVDRYAPPELV